MTNKSVPSSENDSKRPSRASAAASFSRRKHTGNVTCHLPNRIARSSRDESTERIASTCFSAYVGSAATSLHRRMHCSSCDFAFVKCTHLARDGRTPGALAEVLRALCDALRAEVRQRDAPADGERRRTLPLADLLRGRGCCARTRLRARSARAGAVVREDRREELVCVDQPARAPTGAPGT